jgi:hypothetical protein
LKKTVVFLLVLEKGKNLISLIPKNSAFIEEIKIQELADPEDIKFEIEEQKVLNAATYSIYKYSPFTKSAQLFYDVYRGFFGTDDLEGKIKKTNNGIAKLNILLMAGGIVLLFLGAVYTFLNSTYFFKRFTFWNKKNFIQEVEFKDSISTKKEAELIWENTISINEEVKLVSSIEILSEKILGPEDGLWCGVPFYKEYKGKTNLLLIKNDQIIDSITLTSPDLVLENLKDPDLTFYQSWDLDGDGRKEEFVVQKYGGCNGNVFTFIRAGKDFKRLEKIPIIYKDQSQGFSLYVARSKDSFKAEKGIIEVEYYLIPQGEWFKDKYEFDKEKGKFIWLSGGEVS